MKHLQEPSLASPTIPNINIPGLESIPVLGSMLSGHNLLTYIAIILTFVLAFIFYRTLLGLRIRSAFMSMGYVSFFSKEMIAGRGFIGMAAEAEGKSGHTRCAVPD